MRTERKLGAATWRAFLASPARASLDKKATAATALIFFLKAKRNSPALHHTVPFFSRAPAGFSVDEEGNDSELEDAAMGATPTPTPDDGSDLDDVVIELPSLSSTEPKSKTASTAAAVAAMLPSGSGPGILKRSSSVATGLKGNAPAAPVLAMTTSPALVGLNRRLSRDTVVVTHAEIEADVEVSAASALAQAASAEEFAAERWGDNSPPARLSRSLSSSHASGPIGWSGAAGCAKVTRSSHRRRSRANSTSSPLPVLEMSASMPTGGIGFADTAAAAAVDWTTRSFGSGSTGFPRHARRNSSYEAPAVRGSAPLSRSHRMPVWSQGSGSGSGLKSVGRPISLPSGIMQRGIRGGEGVPAAEASSAAAGGGDGGFGWVLRSPGGALDHRRRSQSFAGGGRSGLAGARPDSNLGFSSWSGVGQLPVGPAGAASGDDYGMVGAWTGRSSEAQAQGAVLGDEDQDEDMLSSSAQTPQASPSRQGTSAALHRAHGLSSMARRMDRLEIRSPDVETHAAQVLWCARLWWEGSLANMM